MNPYNKIVTNLSNQDYHANNEAVSNSQLSRIMKSPALINAKMEQTPALRWGSLVHSIVLEPEKFYQEIVVMPDGIDSGKGAKERVREFEASNVGKEIISFEENEQLSAILKAVMSDADASNLLGHPARVENSLFWVDEATGVKCRCRPDFWRHDNIVVDLKTTKDCSAWSFGRSAWDYRYDAQSAFYWDGIQAVTGEAPEAFIFIAVEGKEEPNLHIECYNVEPDVLSLGRARYRESLNIYKECQSRGVFPKKHFGSAIKKLTLPKYAS